MVEPGSPREYLLFRLYGPMAAWGDIAVGEYRPSFERTSKSAILGLLAAALGIKRPDTIPSEMQAEREAAEQQHARLAADYGCCIQVEAVGSLLRDYHTVQRPPEKRKAVYPTRRVELAADELATTLSTRDYRVEGLYAIAIWAKTASPAHALSRLAQALAKPRFTLYLGRKSCPPALPLRAQVISACSLDEAFRSADFGDTAFCAAMDGLEFPIDSNILRFSEEEQDGNMLAVTRRDAPASRRRWQFAERTEYQSVIAREK